MKKSMGKHSNTDKVIRNIMNWASRAEWIDEQAAVFDAHLAPVCDRIGISQEELGQELAEHGYDGMLLGLMFEDFLSLLDTVFTNWWLKTAYRADSLKLRFKRYPKYKRSIRRH